MLWIKNFLKTGFGTFCLVFVPALFFCFFLGTNNTFATDYTGTFNFDDFSSFTQAGGGFCNNDDISKPNCSDYSVLTIIYTGLRPLPGPASGPVLRLNSSSSLFGGWATFPSISVSFDSSTTTTINIFSFQDMRNATQPYTDYTFSFILSNGSCPPTPSGSLNISQNGTYDVTSYAEAVVDIPPETVYGDYHDDLLSIKHSIYVCGAIVLVLYFFYCIYRMIIKSTGGF